MKKSLKKLAIIWAVCLAIPHLIGWNYTLLTGEPVTPDGGVVLMVMASFMAVAASVPTCLGGDVD